MTEDQWHATSDVYEMLRFLHGRISERKLRLYVCACCRHIWDAIQPVSSRRAVEAAEQYADGLVDVYDLLNARAEAWAKVSKAEARKGRIPAGDRMVHEQALLAAAYAAEPSQELYYAITASQCVKGDRERYTALLRDLCGPLPFRPVGLDPAWVAWNGGAVRTLAQAVYDLREMPSGVFDRERVARLVEALEQAGCRDEDVMGHLRQPDGVHVRGCWVVDLLLKKE